MEADFHRAYDIDINDPQWQARTSFRKFGVLIRGLGPDSAFGRFASDKENYNLAQYV